MSYRSDPELLRRLLLQVADQHPGLLKTPKLDVLFHELRDSALNFVLHVRTRDYGTTLGVLQRKLNVMIRTIFKDQGIEIPYPQRDIDIKSGSLNLGSVPSG